MSKFPLKFGSSGVRDLAEHITDRAAGAVIAGGLNYMKGRCEFSSVCIGGDLRPSTERILNAQKSACQQLDITIIDCGRVGTSVLAYYARYGLGKSQPCFMTTASHNPKPENGIKPYLAGEELLKSDEADFLSFVQKSYNALEDVLPTITDVEDHHQKAVDLYVKRYVDFFPENALQGTRIGLWQQSTVGRDVMYDILSGMGAEVVVLERAAENEFVPVDTEAVSEENQIKFKKWVLDNKLDALVSADGDFDRPLLIDNTGTFIPGNILGTEVSKFLGIECVGVTASRNDEVDRKLTEAGIEIIDCKIGSPYVIDEMNQVADKYSYIAGYEGNGGYLLRTDVEKWGRTLKALPTRDAMLPILSVLVSAKEEEMQVSDLFKNYTRKATADRLKLFPTPFTKELMSILLPNIDCVEVNYRNNEIEQLDGSRKTIDCIKENHNLLDIKNLVVKYYSDYGYSNIMKIRYKDGIRIWLDDNNIVHLRASNNSPEFRCYANADDMDKAKELVSLSLGEIIPDMVLEQVIGADRDIEFRDLINLRTDSIKLSDGFEVSRGDKSIFLLDNREIIQEYMYR